MMQEQFYIQEAKKLIEDTSKSRHDLESQVRKLQDELDEQRRKYEEAVRSRSADREKLDELLVQLSNLEAEINLLKRRLALLEEELGRLRKENSRLHVRLRKLASKSCCTGRASTCPCRVGPGNVESH